ncbi:response regulator [Flavobacterium sp.]|uniref:response regulator n=1 Tax=Flavobacterium sp. TaxID=239 RepID=UPI00262889F6|nr:response regulator [Flavobacterium sp.]
MKTPQTIFYLDDDTDDLYFFKEIAESLGHEVSIFVNGTEMLRSLKKKLPDIIFLDIYMPVFDGDEILDIIKKSDEWKHIPVVMISGIYPKSNSSKYFSSGANYLMRKPVNFTELKSSLEEILKIDWENFQAFA